MHTDTPTDTADESFAALVAQARAGDETAATRLVREYEPELRRYVRFRLSHPGVRRLTDSLDVCQSVLATFFVHLQGGNLDVARPRQLFRLLAVMADNKVRDKVRRHNAERRGGGTAAIAGDAETVAATSPDPDPADAAADRELVAALRERVPEADRPVVELWLGGHAWAEIAAATGGTADAVRKRVARAVDRAARELGLIEGGA